MIVQKNNQNADLDNKSDLELAKIWRIEKQTLEARMVSIEDDIQRAPTKGARKRLKKERTGLKARVATLKSASSRHMAEIGKKGAEKMKRRAKQKRRRDVKAQAKAAHDAKVVERKARRAKQKAERKERDEARKNELERLREEQSSKRQAKLGRISELRLARMTRATA